MVSFETSDLTKIGLGFTGVGVVFTLIGVLIFFDKVFLAMGNILFLFGVILTIGLKSAFEIFRKPKNVKGSISLSVGFLIVITGWPLTGSILETYGFIVLFRGYWPTAFLLRKFPILGWMLGEHYGTPYFSRQNAKRVPV